MNPIQEPISIQTALWIGRYLRAVEENGHKKVCDCADCRIYSWVMANLNYFC